MYQQMCLAGLCRSRSFRHLRESLPSPIFRYLSPEMSFADQQSYGGNLGGGGCHGGAGLGSYNPALREARSRQGWRCHLK